MRPQPKAPFKTPSTTSAGSVNQFRKYAKYIVLSVLFGMLIISFGLWGVGRHAAAGGRTTKSPCRRHSSGVPIRETDAIVRAKAKAAWRPACCRSSASARHWPSARRARPLAVLEASSSGSVAGRIDAAKLVVAYEPVWAIGTARPPTTAEVAAAPCAYSPILGGLMGEAAAVRPCSMRLGEGQQTPRIAGGGRRSMAPWSAAPASRRLNFWLSPRPPKAARSARLRVSPLAGIPI